MSNYNSPPKLASTASGMDFDAWMRRPVYVAQCKTAAIAHELCGAKLVPGMGTASRMRMNTETNAVEFDDQSSGLSLFRCLPSYRDAPAKELRLKVAKFIKDQRMLSREVRLTPEARAVRIEALKEHIMSAIDAEDAINRRGHQEGIDASFQAIDVDIENPLELEDLNLPGYESKIEELIRHLKFLGDDGEARTMGERVRN